MGGEKMNQTIQPVPIHQTNLKSGWESFKQGLYEIAKGIFKWCIIIGVTLFILF
jgi:hypothetical protein